MSRENDRSPRITGFGERGGQRIAERLDEAGMVEVLPDLLDRGCVLSDRGSRGLDVVLVLTTT